MIVENYPCLEQFFGSYFHQDWDIEHDEPSDVIRAYLENEPLEQIRKVGLELKSLLSSCDDEELVRCLFELGCYYDPLDDFTSISVWLKLIYEDICKKLIN